MLHRKFRNHRSVLRTDGGIGFGFDFGNSNQNVGKVVSSNTVDYIKRMSLYHLFYLVFRMLTIYNNPMIHITPRSANAAMDKYLPTS
jgi:hypothetical protein